ncbi:MAG: winged helix-turn-helix transcriptional regulator [Actinomycetaceae bacterium]|nr:winged helix-turn-helix transcriptional regulator [Actinomycetaceae bacterium]
MEQVSTEVHNMHVAAKLFRALDDPSRLVILHHLLTGPHRVKDLVEHLSISQSTVSQHLAVLKSNGLVQVRAEGRASVYSVTNPETLTALLISAERLLAENGQIVELCPEHSAS